MTKQELINQLGQTLIKGKPIKIHVLNEADTFSILAGYFDHLTDNCLVVSWDEALDIKCYRHIPFSIIKDIECAS